jgi:hypothetical protein
MVEQGARTRRRRLGAHGMMFRRRRVFSRLREGFTYDEIAHEEGVSSSRIRQIVFEELQKRLQLDHIAPAVQLGAEAIAAGDIAAINPYLKALDRLDRYRSRAETRSMTTRRARSSWTRSTASPTISASTRSWRRLCAST